MRSRACTRASWRRSRRLGALIGQAVATAEAGAPQQGLGLLERIDPAEVAQHQPYWVAAAYLQRACGMAQPAQASLVRAIGLTLDPRVRAYLAGR